MSVYLRFKEPVTALKAKPPYGMERYCSLDIWMDSVGWSGTIMVKDVATCNLIMLALAHGEPEHILSDRDIRQMVFTDGTMCLLQLDTDQYGLYIIKQLSEIKAEIYANDNKQKPDAGGQMVHPGGGDDGPEGDR